MRPTSLHLVSDFNIDQLKTALIRVGDRSCSVSVAPFGQVYQALTATDGAVGPDTIAVVWTRPESVIDGFRRVVGFEPVDHDLVLEEVEQFKAAVLALARNCRYVLVPEWAVRPDRRLYGMLEMKPGRGARHLLARMNLALSALMDTVGNITVFPVDRWLHQGARPYATKMELITKTPFSPQVFDAAARDIYAVLRGWEGEARKVVVLDLDNTLWGGIVGDDGWEQLRLGGHDHVGEAFVSFQRALLALRNRGIQLAIASKNEESVAIEALTSHTEMVLRKEHFAGWRINWNDKAQNLLELSQELRLGLESFVFIDDNPVERARVSDALPEVLVPDWPSDPCFYTEALDRLDAFDVAQLTDEDFGRGASRAAERLRQDSLAQHDGPSLEEWLTTLDTEVRVAPVSSANLARVTQLFNKTNQLNLKTRRLSAPEIEEWLKPPNRYMWAARVGDKFGDSGLTGVISIEVTDRVALVTDLILSCRVMGRRVEYAMMHVVSQSALEQGADTLRLVYCPTDRNKPCLRMLEESQLSPVSDHVFEWTRPGAYPLPDVLRLV